MPLSASTTSSALKEYHLLQRSSASASTAVRRKHASAARSRKLSVGKLIEGRSCTRRRRCGPPPVTAKKKARDARPCQIPGWLSESHHPRKHTLFHLAGVF